MGVGQFRGRNPPGFVNVVRLSNGEAPERPSGWETVVVTEVALDDLNPQVTAVVSDQAFKVGALGVTCTPVLMKKNRAGTLLTIFSDRDQAPALQELILREMGTLGLRIREERRVCLQRKHAAVATEWGAVRVKIGYQDGREFNAAPEFEDCRALAEAREIPVKRLLEAALHAYRKDHS